MKIAQRFFNRGNSKIIHKDYAGAITLFDKGIESNPKFAWAYLNRGIAKNFSLEDEGSAIYFSGNLEIDQVDPAGYRTMGIPSVFKSQSSAVVLADFDKAIEINPWHAKAYFSRGMLKSGLENQNRVTAESVGYQFKTINRERLSQGSSSQSEYWHDDLANVMADFDKAIEIDPEFAEAYYTRGVTKIYRQNKSEASFQESGAIDTSLDSSYAASDNHIETESMDFGGAIADFDKAIDINPNYADAYYCRGLTKNYLHNQSNEHSDFSWVSGISATCINRETPDNGEQPIDYQGIIADFDMAIKINPNHAKAYCSRGLTKIFCQDQWEVLTEPQKFNSSLKQDKEVLQTARGVKNYNFKNYAAAIADFDKAIEINPKYANAYYFRGIAKLYCYDHVGGMVDCKKAIELDPTYAEDYKNRELSQRFPGSAERGYLN